MAQSTRQGLMLTLMALAVIGGWGAGASAQDAKIKDFLRLSRNVPGETKPILLQADDIATWMEGTDRVFLLRGRVLVEQGVVQLRCQQAVIWADLKGLKETRILHVDLYAEGDVQLESGATKDIGASALLDLSTRGELKVRGNVTRESHANDPLYPRAKATLKAPPPPAAPATPTKMEAAPVNPLLPASPQDQAAPARAETRPPLAVPVPSPEGVNSASKLSFLPTGSPEGPVGDSGIQTVSYQRFELEEPPPLPPVVTPPAAPPPLVAPVAPPPVSPGPTPGPSAPAPVPAPSGTPGPGASAIVGPPARPAPPSAAPPRYFSIAPRYGNSYHIQPGMNQDTIVITGGVILTVRGVDRLNVVDIAADELVAYMHGNIQEFVSGLRSNGSQAARDLQFYLSGNVIIREQMGRENRTLQADEVFYDVERNVAVARRALLQINQPGVPDPVYLRAAEVQQLSATEFKGIHGEIFSSRLPSDPGIEIQVQEATLDLNRRPRTSIFGTPIYDRLTGQPEYETQEIIHADNVVLELEHVPIFWLPFIQGDAREPLGPITDVGIGYNSIFGARFDLGLNTYSLLGIDPLPGTRWRTTLEYLSLRGPAAGTDFEYAGKDPLDIPGRYSGVARLWGIYDTGPDILGGIRDNIPHPDWRGRIFWQQNFTDLPQGFQLQTQLAALSDRNFLEQYFKPEFDNGFNQDTFLYLKQQQDNWAWTGLVQPHLQPWYTETAWLPRADGYLIGQDLFKTLTYSTWASAGYANLRKVDQGAPPFTVTDTSTNTGRFDWSNELSLPFYLGPVKVAPYGVLDLTEYTSDIQGQEIGRAYGGVGVRGSLPLTHLYPDAESTLFNVNGINHKVVLGGNYYVAGSNEPYTRFPQLDRLNDDATDQSLRDIKPLEPILNPKYGPALENSPFYDPQTFAIRRLLESRIDTRDNIQVLEGDVFQRWQTKRGFPEQQHIVDWMTLDLSGSFYPAANRDNFGHSFSFLQYDYVWNIGDRTSISSTGWLDPFPGGAHVFTVGASMSRPDRTAFYLGFRELEPLGSQEVIGSVSYVLSPKYAVTGIAIYDFGTNQAQSDSLIITRMGKDLQVSMGISYNAITNNFGFVFTIVPNIMANSRSLSLSPTTFTGLR